MGFIDDYFSIYALFVLFRESIEASIIVSVLLQFLARSFPQLKKQVWWGVAVGGSGAIIFGIIFITLFYVARDNAFNGPNKSIFQGSVAWFAGILISFLAFAMLRYKGWEDKIARKLHAKAQERLEGKASEGSDVEAPEPTTCLGRAKARVRSCMTSTTQPIVSASTACWGKTSSAASSCWRPTTSAFSSCWASFTSTIRRPFARWLPPRPQSDTQAQPDQQKPVMELGSSHGYAIFTVVAITVVREGIESVIFLAGVGNTQPRALPLPGIVGLLMGITVGAILYYTGKQVKDIKYFLILMALILFFIAGGQFMLGTLFLTAGGMFGYQSPWINQRPWYMQPVYDWSKCCPDNIDGETAWYQFLSLMKAIFGYQAQPTMLQLTVYYSYWFIVICCAIYKWYSGSLFDADWKYKKEMKKKEAERLKALELQQQQDGKTDSGSVLHHVATSSTELDEQAVISAKLKGLAGEKFIDSKALSGCEDAVTTDSGSTTSKGSHQPSSSSSQLVINPLQDSAPLQEVATTQPQPAVGQGQLEAVAAPPAGAHEHGHQQQ